MKKTYISPEFLFVELRGIQMLAESVPVGKGTATGDAGGWVKEEEDYNPISDKKIWNDEW